MAKKLTQAYVKRQIRYFRLQHKHTNNLENKLRYSKSIWFWENKLKEMRKH